MKSDVIREFANPSATYRGAPFWAWNCKLDKDQLLRQIDEYILRPMGILGGPVLESREPG